jgi:hypothetical protein
MEERVYRAWDVGLKFVGLPVLMIGAIWGWYQYYDQKDLNHKLRQQAVEQERRVQIWNDHIALAKRLYQLTGTITSTKGRDRVEAERKFWTLYHGELQLVESPNSALRQYAAAFAVCLERQCATEEMSGITYQAGRAQWIEQEERIKQMRNSTAYMRARPTWTHRLKMYLCGCVTRSVDLTE